MNKVSISVVSVLVLASAGFLLFSNNDSDSDNKSSNPGDTNQIENQSATAKEQGENEPEETTTVSSSTGFGYVDYSEKTLADSSLSKRVLFFHAPWCSVCNFYEGQIEDKPVPSDVTILKIDFDSEDALKQQYKVTTQSTFVLLDSEGNIVESWPFARGLKGIDDLYSKI